MTTAPATDLLEHAEALLAERLLQPALTAYDAAEQTGAEPDRCAAGRWMCHMLLGAYEDAWLQSDAIRARGTADPLQLWNGEPIDGRRVMLRCLRGFGDTVQYLRWLPLLGERAVAVTVQVAPPMLPLLRHFTDADEVVTWNADGETDTHLWDVQVESAELPYLFRASAATLPPPSRIGFSPDEVRATRAALGRGARPRVGLVWTGSDYDAARSLPFATLTPLLTDARLEFWSMQDDRNNTEWLALAEQSGSPPHVIPQNDIEHLALFASQMDLVITVDTLAAHLAGSLGVPVWTLLKHGADWRWGVTGDRSPWYPSMRLFRQPQQGAWDAVIAEVCRSLRAWSGERPW